jgi:hypothetical protein
MRAPPAVARLPAAGRNGVERLATVLAFHPQESCCNKAYKHPKAGQNEFDLSFWAYEQLAHPM